MLIEKLLTDGPGFHAWPDGTAANWAVAPDVLRFIASQLTPGMQTLETGAGQTTVAFAIARTRHICITPDREQADKINAYIAGLEIENSVTFIHESSDIALAAGTGIPERLDFVLIDGAHRFPFPVIDWHFTEHRVPAGGVIAVDDFLMPSVRILYDFLAGEEEWELIKAFEVTSFFRRVKHSQHAGDWEHQRINRPHIERVARKKARASRAPGLLGLARRLKSRILN